MVSLKCQLKVKNVGIFGLSFVPVIENEKCFKNLINVFYASCVKSV